MQIPKYVYDTVKRLNSLVDQADILKCQIETWAENHGADTSSIEWQETVRDDCNSVSGMFAEGINEYFDNLSNKL